MRSPVRIARAGPSSSATATGAVSIAVPSAQRRHGDRRVERPEDRGGDRDAADDARLLEQQLRAAALVGRHERLGGQVAGADVLAERRGDDRRDRLLAQLHVSSLGSAPCSSVTCTFAKPGSSVGKSVRK